MKKPKPQAQAMQADAMQLIAIEPLRHDGQAIAPGEVFAVPQAAAERLLALGLARLIDELRHAC